MPGFSIFHLTLFFKSSGLKFIEVMIKAKDLVSRKKMHNIQNTALSVRGGDLITHYDLLSRF